MEISYYFECDKRLEEVQESLLDCFTENAITAELRFEMDFHEHYKNITSEKSKLLWVDVEKSLKLSFGRLEIEFALKQIVEGSVKISVEMNPLRDKTENEMSN